MGAGAVLLGGQNGSSLAAASTGPWGRWSSEWLCDAHRLSR